MKLKITTLITIEGNQELIPIGFKNTLLNRETK